MTTNEMPNVTKLADQPVGRIVACRPDAARVFEKHRIDYCCQGGKTLGEACTALGLDLAQVLHELAAPPPTGDEPVSNWLEEPLARLCDHIERRHHDYLRAELPRLEELIARVVRAHGDRHPELADVQAAFGRLRAELEPHMWKEEQVLFPAIRSMDDSRRNADHAFGSVANPIRCMVDEHERAGEELACLRRLTGDYEPPRDACPTWRVMLDGLAQLERDMHEHVHKENSILFPRAIELEAALAQRAPNSPHKITAESGR